MKKETFLELHERLSSSKLIGWVSEYAGGEPLFLPSGLCAIQFNGECLGHNKIISEYFELSSMPILGDNGIYTDWRQNIILLCAAINNEL